MRPDLDKPNAPLAKGDEPTCAHYNPAHDEAVAVAKPLGHRGAYIGELATAT